MGNFVDHVKITAKAGNGGNGSVSFHREKFVLNGGPDGGDGGVGGDVVLFADPNMHTLLDFRFKSKYTAENGADGSGGRCTGKRGENLIIKVPVGTVVRDEASGAVVADMFEPGSSKTLLRGGRGGWGNSHFATPTRQAPNFAKPGVKTEIHTFLLELKTIADVGLVGYPNVGKSTIPVSYTHLDVYKRQTTCSLSRGRMSSMLMRLVRIPGMYFSMAFTLESDWCSWAHTRQPSRWIISVSAR